MIDRIFERLAGIINHNPKRVAAVIGVVFIIALYGMTLITMETGNDTYLEKDSKAGILNNHYADTFSSNSLILIVETSDPLDPQVLSYIDELERDLRQQDNVVGSASVVDLLKSANGGILPKSKGEIDRIVALIPAEIKATAIPSNVLTLVQISLSEGLSEDAKSATFKNVEALIDNNNPPPGVKISVSGSTAFAEQMKTEMGSSIGVLIGAAMVLMVIVMGILFAYARHRFLPVLFVGIGLTTAMGFMGLAGIKLNMAVMGAFPVMIGLGIDYGIQFHARLDEEARKGSLDKAVMVTVTRTGPAVMYAMLATCMGFIAMFISTVPMIRSFGLVAMIGVMSCFVISLIGIPTIAHLLDYTPKPQKTELCYAVGEGACDNIPSQTNGASAKRARKKSSWSYGQFLTDISVKIAKNPIPILLIAGMVTIIGFQIDPLIPIETSENSFVPSDMPAKVQMDKVTGILGSSSTADFIIQGSRVTDLDTVKWLKEFQDYELAHHTDLTGATSIVTYILAYNGGVMPEDQNQLNALIEKIPDSVKKSYLSGSMEGVIRFTTVKMEMSGMNDLRVQMEKDIAFLQPPTGITLEPVGSFYLFTSLISGLTSSKEAMTLLGFVLVFVFLALVYRHLHAVTPLVPIIFIVGWNAMAMYVLGIAYTPLTATLGSMTIGVAAEYTILVMERYAEEQERLNDHVAAIQESVNKIGTAITISGLATFFGFSALCLSTFPIISNFGITTLIAVGFSLMGAIFIMPAILSVMGDLTERLEARKKHSR
ncbi:MAG TPA: hydrophobe/amphiphile efflux-3 (HAE3) family transporter [Methanoregula sp.]|nr:hydrophobe/amphiphile efflux-3 (HAE3) family transporter [Methanoregula sp.]